MVVDLLLLALTAGIVYALMSEGLWGSALMFFNVLFASLITFNFYEPLAKLIVDNVGSESFAAPFADSVTMMALFATSLLLLRLATESVAPSMVRFPTPLYHLGRLVFSIGAALIMMAMLLLGFQASPVQKKMLGVWDYKHEPKFKERIDKDFLAFFQYTTGYTFPRNGIGPADKEFPNRPYLFDPRGDWLLIHQQARPYGTEQILEEAPEPPAAAATPPAAGEPGPGGPGVVPPGGPQGPNRNRGRGPGAPNGPGGPGGPGPGGPGPGNAPQ